MLGSLYYAGWCLTLLWMPKLSDTYGRAGLFRFAMVLHTILYIVIMFSRSFTLTLASVFVTGLFTSLRYGVGWPFLLEIIPSQSRPVHAMIYGVLGALCGLVSSVIFFCITNRVQVFLAFGLAFQIIALVCSYMLPESPVFLISKEHTEGVITHMISGLTPAALSPAVYAS